MKVTLDAEEYFHLALHASSVSDPHACMAYLEEVLQQQPANARAVYLRAVQYAEVGLTRRAMDGIHEALALEPGLEVARFHLGLLQLLDRDRREEAKASFRKLLDSADLTLRASAEVLVALADDDAVPVPEKLARGLAHARDDHALGTFLKRLVEHLSGAAKLVTCARGEG